MFNNKNKLKLVVLGSVVTAVLPLTTIAENKALIQAQKYSENDDRIDVDDGKVIFEHDFGANHTLNLEYNWDAVSGASPTWDSVSGASAAEVSDAVSGASPCIDEDGNYYELCRDTRQIEGIIGDGFKSSDDLIYKNIGLDDFRNSLAALYTYRTPEYRNEINLGASYSEEDDFKNTGISADYLINTDRSRNRSISVGASFMKNDVFDYLKDEWNNFDLSNFQLGLTQVFNQTLVAKINLYGILEKGHLSNPYFNVVTRINVSLDPASPYFKYYLTREKRPEERKSGGISAQLSKSLNSSNALQTSYRYYQDSWAVKSHTIDLRSYHYAGTNFRFNPLVRYYKQTAANFFKAHDADDNVFDENSYASADHRLGNYHSWTFQLGIEYLQSEKLSWNIYSGHQSQSSGLDLYWTHIGAQYKY